MKFLYFTLSLALSSVVAGFHDNGGRFLAGRSLQMRSQYPGPPISSEHDSTGIRPVYYPQSQHKMDRRWASPQHQEIIYERMLSQALKKKPSLSHIGYAGKKLTPQDVHAIHKAAQDIIHQLSKVSAPLVLFLGNSPSYLFQALTAHDISTYNIHNVPISGPLPPSIPPQMAKAYADHVLHEIMAKPFKHVVLVDIYSTGASKEEFTHLLAACAAYLKMPKIAPVQIPIIDKSQAKPSPSGPIPFLGEPVVMEVPGLARDLTDGMYPRIIANYPTSFFGTSPDEIAKKDNLDGLGRIEVIKAIHAG